MDYLKELVVMLSNPSLKAFFPVVGKCTSWICVESLEVAP